MSARSSWRSILLRAVLGGALGLWLIRTLLNAFGVDLAAELRQGHGTLLAAAAGTYLLTYLPCVVRWRMLLEVQGVQCSFATVMRLYVIGTFFNMFVPGSVGGDVAKAAVLAGETPGRRVEALLSIFVDRVMGGVGLLVLMFVAVLASIPFLRTADPRLAWTVVAFGLAGGTATACVVALTFRDRWMHLRPAQALRGLVLRVLPDRVVHVLHRALGALDRYRTKPRVLLAALALSVLVHLVAGTCMLLLGRAIGEARVSGIFYLVAATIANGAAMVPLTPGGLGGRDVIMTTLLAAAGAAPAKAAATSVLYSVVVSAWGLLGGIVFVLDPVIARRSAARIPPPR